MNRSPTSRTEKILPFLHSLTSPEIYYQTEMERVITPMAHAFPVSSKKKTIRYSIPASFDIETSSFYEQDDFSGDFEKVGIIYVWQFAIYGYCFYGRTIDEYVDFIGRLKTVLGLDGGHLLTVYVHNLAYEFQFIRKYFEWIKVFSLKPRTPAYALSEGIEYRCSYILSGYSLETIGKNLLTYHVEKKTGDLDYSKIRHHLTPLTEKELGYCIYDVLVVNCYIQEKIETEKTINHIPMTKTGYVRRYIRKNCLYGGSLDHKKTPVQYKKYHNYMMTLTVEPDEYRLWRSAFQGGFTHASYNHVRQILYGVESRDITSSYPYAMVSELYPISKGEIIKPTSLTELETVMKKYAVVLEIRFDGLQAANDFEHYLALSKCNVTGYRQVDNGRIVYAERAVTTITDVDYWIIKKYYTWKGCAIGKAYKYKRGYLPKQFILSVLNLYRDKTILKGVEGKESEYMNAKEQVNSAYGMMVTDIVRPNYKYDVEQNEWCNPDQDDLIASIEKYNTQKNRFLSYLWGIYVTAYARKNLFALIYNIGFDYVYADTDSIKFLNPGKYDYLFDAYNKKVEQKLKAVCAWYSIPDEMVKPKTIKGVEKMLGVYDPEGVYNIFKTLGAKRYMTFKDDMINITVAGVNKRTAVPYLIDRRGLKTAGGKIDMSDLSDASKKILSVFSDFDDGLIIPAEYSGKKTLTYIDDDRTGRVTDYMGNVADYKQLSGIYMESSEYNMSMAIGYITYLQTITRRDEK